MRIPIRSLSGKAASLRYRVTGSGEESAGSTVRAGPERRRGSSQPVVQTAELRAKEAGLPVLPVWVAWKPKPVEAPAAMVAL